MWHLKQKNIGKQQYDVSLVSKPRRIETRLVHVIQEHREVCASGKPSWWGSISALCARMQSCEDGAVMSTNWTLSTHLQQLNARSLVTLWLRRLGWNRQWHDLWLVGWFDHWNSRQQVVVSATILMVSACQSKSYSNNIFQRPHFNIVRRNFILYTIILC